jgi:hypothetical protein
MSAASRLKPAMKTLFEEEERNVNLIAYITDNKSCTNIRNVTCPSNQFELISAKYLKKRGMVSIPLKKLNSP